jgi:MtN3 and saliva related transmembrane protein
MKWFIIGTLAALLTTFGFVPQIIKIYKTKSVKDVSIDTLFQFALGVIFWTLYGIHLGDVIIAVGNAISFMTLVVGIAFYYHYNKTPR